MITKMVKHMTCDIVMLPNSCMMLEHVTFLVYFFIIVDQLANLLMVRIFLEVVPYLRVIFNYSPN
jgi:hypothetical protein